MAHVMKKTPRQRPTTASPSEWQRIVRQRMDELLLSLQEVATAISSRTHAFSKSTIWSWLNSTDGVPRRRSYNHDVNARLASFLKMKPELLAAAYDASNRYSLAPESTTHNASQVAALRMVFIESTRTWTPQEILVVIDAILPQ